MASDKRPILSGKRARSRRKRAALRAANRTDASPTPECDSDEDAKRKKHQQLSSSSDKAATQSENEDALLIEDGLVFVCRPTMPDFCSAFRPRDEEQLQPRAADCKTFSMHIPTFQQTPEGFVTYTLELTTCNEARHKFQLERRFSEFVACAAELNKQLTEDAEDFHWELPAKTWFRVTQTSALEERRAQLEQALETLLLQQDRGICNLPVLRDFLMLDIFGVQVAEQKNLDAAAHYE